MLLARVFTGKGSPRHQICNRQTTTHKIPQPQPQQESPQQQTPSSPTKPQPQPQASPAPSHIAVLKGAPEMVRGFLAPVPPTYDASYKRFAAQGARVIALARRVLPVGLEGPQLRGMGREEVEVGMEFMGFAVFQVGGGWGGGGGGGLCAEGAFRRAMLQSNNQCLDI